MTIVGDVDAGRKVGVKDVYKAALAYGTSLGRPSLNGRVCDPDSDLNSKDEVEIKNYYVVCRHYGEVNPKAALFHV